jgi:hypothetical protein
VTFLLTELDGKMCLCLIEGVVEQDANVKYMIQVSYEWLHFTCCTARIFITVSPELPHARA